MEVKLPYDPVCPPVGWLVGLSVILLRFVIITIAGFFPVRRLVGGLPFKNRFWPVGFGLGHERKPQADRQSMSSYLYQEMLNLLLFRSLVGGDSSSPVNLPSSGLIRSLTRTVRSWVGQSLINS